MNGNTSSSVFQALQSIFLGLGKEFNSTLILLDYRNKTIFSALWLEGLESGKVTILGQESDFTDPSKRFVDVKKMILLK